MNQLTSKPNRKQRRRKQNNRTGLTIGIAVVLGIVALIAFNVQGSGVAGGNFELTAYQGASQLGGSNVDFDEIKRQAKGKPIVLNLWGGLCPPCRAEMPGFQRVYERHQDDFLMLGLDVGPFFGLGTRNSAFALLNELNITYPAAFAVDRSPISQFGASALPSTFFFDGEGNLVDQRIGFIDEASFERTLLDLIGPAASTAAGDDDS